MGDQLQGFPHDDARDAAHDDDHCGDGSDDDECGSNYDDGTGQTGQIDLKVLYTTLRGPLDIYTSE